MKKLISVVMSLLFVFMIIPLSDIDVSASISGNCGASVVWEYDDLTKTLTVSGIGDMSEINAYQSFDNNHNKIKFIVITDGVTSIGSYFFGICEYVTSISIPTSITKINLNAFDNCSSLINVYYDGTKTQWDNIVISAGNDCLLNASINYKQEQHTCTFGEWRIINEPTCVATGSKIRECSCGNKETEVISATGIHNLEWKVSKEATCTENGDEKQHCTVCSYEAEARTINKLGHKAGEWQEINKPTCTDNGLKAKKCENCGEVLEQENIAPTGHEFGAWKTTVKETEERNGEESRTCKKCKYTETRVIDNINPTEKELLGDCDNNGNVSAVDARLVLQVVAGIKESKDLNYVNADVNKDNKITAVDARFILQIVAGIKE